jgi:excisionase family DNA binding protein
MSGERHFTTRQVAEICGVNLNTIQNWARRDIINGFRTAGGHLRFRESELLAFLTRQGIPLPPELERGRPRVYCLCQDCEPAKAVGRWLRKDFDCVVFGDPWELAMALGEEIPDLLIVDAVESPSEPLRMLDAVASNPKTAHVPAIVLTSGGGTGGVEPGAGSRRTTLPVTDLKPGAVRRSAAQLLGR